MHDIDFVRDLIYLQQLYLIDAHIDSLAPLGDLLEKKKQKIREEENQWEKIMLHIEGICVETDFELAGVGELRLYEKYITEMIINGKRVIC